MRHRKFGRKLNRSSSHRKALRKNLITSLLRHGKIVTTMPKAKAARSDAERLITIAKVDTVHNHRKVFAYLQDKEITQKLFKEIAVRYRDTAGGYTAIHRLADNRLGDNASQVVWQLVTWEPGTKPKPRRKKKTQKSRPAKEDTASAKETEEKTAAAEPQEESSPPSGENKGEETEKAPESPKDDPGGEEAKE